MDWRDGTVGNAASTAIRKGCRGSGRPVFHCSPKTYFCVLTTLPEGLASDDVVLELYRIRWQIELFFKRCKGLLHFDQLRAFDPNLVRTYCLAKLIEVALIQCRS